eukprot:gene2619-biopygen2588
MNQRPNAIKSYVPFSRACFAVFGVNPPAPMRTPFQSARYVSPLTVGKAMPLSSSGDAALLGSQRGSDRNKYASLNLLNSFTSAEYTVTGSESDRPKNFMLVFVVGESRIPTRSAPISRTTASTTSSVNLILFSIDPPYLSVLLFAESPMN